MQIQFSFYGINIPNLINFVEKKMKLVTDINL